MQAGRLATGTSPGFPICERRTPSFVEQKSRLPDECTTIGAAPITYAVLIVAPPVITPVARKKYPPLPELPGIAEDKPLSMRQAVVAAGVQGGGPPSEAMSGE